MKACTHRVYAIAWSRHGIAVAWLWPNGFVEHAQWFMGFQRYGG